MSRYSNMRERDDQGRFMSDDDRGYSRSRSSGRDRDEQGRFMSEGRRAILAAATKTTTIGAILAMDRNAMRMAAL